MDLRFAFASVTAAFVGWKINSARSLKLHFHVRRASDGVRSGGLNTGVLHWHTLLAPTEEDGLVLVGRSRAR